MQPRLLTLIHFTDKCLPLFAYTFSLSLLLNKPHICSFIFKDRNVKRIEGERKIDIVHSRCSLPRTRKSGYRHCRALEKSARDPTRINWEPDYLGLGHWVPGIIILKKKIFVNSFLFFIFMEISVKFLCSCLTFKKKKEYLQILKTN